MSNASLLSDGRTLRGVDRGIVSALPGVGPRRPYDRWAVAAFYDAVVAARVYNRLMWGTTPKAYVAFERRAIASRDDGVMLDAACGSLAFTANLFAGHRAARSCSSTTRSGCCDAPAGGSSGSAAACRAI